MLSGHISLFIRPPDGEGVQVAAPVEEVEPPEARVPRGKKGKKKKGKGGGANYGGLDDDDALGGGRFSLQLGVPDSRGGRGKNSFALFQD